MSVFQKQCADTFDLPPGKVRPKPLRAGYTLVETVLAVAISALLIGLIAAGMRIYTNVVADRRADVVNAQLARVLLQRMAADLRAAYVPVEDEEDSGDAAALTGDDLAADGGAIDATAETEIDAIADLTSATVQAQPGLYGNAYELQVDTFGQFAQPVRYDMLTGTGDVDPLAANLLSDPKVVTWYVRSATETELAGTPLQSVNTSESSDQKTVLVRRIQSRALAAFETALAGIGTSEAGEQLLSDQVISIEFAYHDGFEWLESWDSSLDGGLPVAVGITLTLIDEADIGSSDSDALKADNIFQTTVRLPAAEPPSDDTLTEGF